MTIIIFVVLVKYIRERHAIAGHTYSNVLNLKKIQSAFKNIHLGYSTYILEVHTEMLIVYIFMLNKIFNKI